MIAITTADQTLVAEIERLLASPAYFRQVLDCGADHAYREVLIAWSDVREKHALQRDELGRYFLVACQTEPV